MFKLTILTILLIAPLCLANVPVCQWAGMYKFGGEDSLNLMPTGPQYITTDGSFVRITGNWRGIGGISMSSHVFVVSNDGMSASNEQFSITVDDNRMMTLESIHLFFSCTAFKFDDSHVVQMFLNGQAQANGQEDDGDDKYSQWPLTWITDMTFWYGVICAALFIGTSYALAAFTPMIIARCRREQDHVPALDFELLADERRDQVMNDIV